MRIQFGGTPILKVNQTQFSDRFCVCLIPGIDFNISFSDSETRAQGNSLFPVRPPPPPVYVNIYASGWYLPLSLGRDSYSTLLRQKGKEEDEKRVQRNRMRFVQIDYLLSRGN